MGLLLCCLSIGGENASLVLALHSGQWPETLVMKCKGADFIPCFRYYTKHSAQNTFLRRVSARHFRYYPFCLGISALVPLSLLAADCSFCAEFSATS
jgi:hypothetical protein